MWALETYGARAIAALHNIYVTIRMSNSEDKIFHVVDVDPYSITDGYVLIAFLDWNATHDAATLRSTTLYWGSPNRIVDQNGNYLDDVEFKSFILSENGKEYRFDPVSISRFDESEFVKFARLLTMKINRTNRERDFSEKDIAVMSKILSFGFEIRGGWIK